MLDRAAPLVRLAQLGLVAGAVLVAAAAAHASPDSFLDPLGPVADAQRTHLFRVIAITMIAIVPVLVALPLILWRYHRRTGTGSYRPGGLYRPDWEFSGPLEIAMWGVPFTIIAVLGWWLWHETRALDPYKPTGPDPLQIQAIGLDWKWLFVYPEQGFATLGEMAVPVGRPVRIELTTDTVMQSLRISALAGQIYAMPGMRTELNFTASRPGETRGENTQFSGMGFAQQSFTVRALGEADWTRWAAEAPLRPLDAQTYGLLAKPTTPKQTADLLGAPAEIVRLAPVEPHLFHEVMMRYHDGTPVPASRQPGAPGFEALAGSAQHD